MPRFERKKSIEDLLVMALESQARVNRAMIDDLELAHSRLVEIEDYLQVVEARREAELKKKGNEDA
jgi:hypothetical protein